MEWWKVNSTINYSNIVNEVKIDQIPQILFLATLQFRDLPKLMIDPVHNDLTWPPIAIKLASYISKFEGKNREDRGDNVSTFHL